MESKKSGLIQVPAEELEILLSASAFIISPTTDEGFEKADARVRKAFLRLCGALYVSTEGNESTATGGVSKEDGFVYFKFGNALVPKTGDTAIGAKIIAIKLYRALFDVGLKEAKDAIESGEMMKWPCPGTSELNSKKTITAKLKYETHNAGLELLLFDNTTDGAQIG